MPSPRTPPATRPGTTPDQLVQQVTLTAVHAVRTEQWRAVLDALNVGALRKAAADAKAAGTDPAIAVTARVQASFRALARWDEAVTELHRELLAAAGAAGLCEKARAVGRTEEDLLEQAWVRLVETVVRYHHGSGRRLKASRAW